MSLVQSIKTCFAKYSTFEGISRRSEFLWYALIYCALSLSAVLIATYVTQISIAYQIEGLSGNSAALVTGINLSIYSSFIWALVGIIWVILFIPFLAAGSRRLHDINISGRWQLVQLTLIGYIWLIVWWSLKVPPTFTFRQAIASCWSKYFRFSGTSKRSELWWFILYTALALMLLQYIYLNLSAILYNLAIQGTQLGSTLYTIWQVISFAITCLLIIPLIAVGSRRLHDTNRSGWLQVILLTGVGAILLCIWWSQATNSNSNERRTRITISPNNSPGNNSNACNQCGSSLNQDSSFCTTCGASQTEAIGSVYTCSNCGSSVKINSQFCTNCGASKTQNEQVTVHVCSNCGNELQQDSKFCPNCGTPTA